MTAKSSSTGIGAGLGAAIPGLGPGGGVGAGIAIGVAVGIVVGAFVVPKCMRQDKVSEVPALTADPRGGGVEGHYM